MRGKTSTPKGGQPVGVDAERERLTMKPGEDAVTYIARMHRADGGNGKCRCPNSYAWCKYAYYYRAQTGQWSTDCGFGWAAAAVYGWGPEAASA